LHRWQALSGERIEGISVSKQINPPESVTTPLRMAGEERRMQILRVAVSLFSQRGFSGTTTREIAQAAGVSEAMVFRHFATKEELYSAILDHKACSDSSFNPVALIGDAVKRKDDRAVFEGLALSALEHHECDPEFHRLLLHAALEQHELAEMFWERNVRPVYEFLGDYIRQRQTDGVMIDMEPAVVVRYFIGMVIHHSLNNTLWDPKRSLLNISNEAAAHSFANILLSGINNHQTSEQPTSTGKQTSRADVPESN
jgi:AcrR family transcriptional regulator